MMIIDFHTHVLPPRIKEDRSDCVEKDAAFAQIYSGEKVKIVTAEDLIENMDREGIARSVIVNYGWSTHELCVETNDYILESVARYPERLAGFCAISSLNSDESLAEVERCARGGARGIGELRPDVQLPPSADQETLAPLAGILRDNKMMLLTHSSEPVGHLYPGKGTATPERLLSFISGFSGVTVICAHWGGGLPFYTLMPEVRQALEDVYFDTAISPFLYRPEVYRLVRDMVGADRILFGSDYPVIAPSRLLKEINAAGLPEEDRDLILSGNARRLLGE
jgi:predicted TIM-barrel fold metal-dependent hydrolase